MRITDIIGSAKPTLSFEVFPPKTTDKFETVLEATHKIADLSPSYVSVTYGAGGGTSRYTADIASDLLSRGVTPLAHLSCISSTRSEIRDLLSDLSSRGIENILALRGDIPKGEERPLAEYRYASQLIEEIVDFGGFTIGGACYPEGHPESENGAKDIEALRIKVASGCSFLTTQMFFDNNILYNFMYRLYRAGVSVPVVPGIMPVTSASQIKRIISISGNELPQRFIRLVDRYGDNPLAMKQAGIAYATEQIVDLYANGFNAVHVYSMNKPDVAKAIKNNISHILA
jgi:methylenetetrahydrofolate reductase (NADPH)